MKRLALALLFTLAAAPSAAMNFAANGEKYLPKPIAEPEPSFPAGERLVYDVYWLGFHVGTGQIWVKEKTVVGGREAWHVVGTARANGFLSNIYHVRDEAHSWIDARTGESIQFLKKVDERGAQAHEKDTFDKAAGKGRHRSLKTGETKLFGITTPVHDVLSVFFWARRQPLVPGRKIETVLSCNQADWRLEVNVVKQEVEALRGHGIVDHVVVEPRAEPKGEGKGPPGRAWVYLKNDPRRTPVLVKFKTPFGAVVGVLRNS